VTCGRRLPVVSVTVIPGGHLLWVGGTSSCRIGRPECSGKRYRHSSYDPLDEEDTAVTPTLHLTGDPEADDLLSRDPFALLAGMLLDQQMPLERAFGGPWRLAQRLGVTTFEPGAVATHDPDDFAKLMAGPPAVHRYPAAMAGRLQKLAAEIVERFDGDAARVWTTAEDGKALLASVKSLPGFGEQKAKIFVALLGKQLGVQPPGWREAAGPYGEEGTSRSVADVTDAESLARVRSFKQAAKAASKAKA
jgi:uncharacterized HhH-GPD family protein